ncbi:DUF3298 and DUF4163 domain-containing protein [Romboutsia hominis]|uniref:DUF3298 and DUF4163 domain-containing protein n=1 Tax=Romboutsia hominis TaxID=1507512 RepID=UPI000AFC38F3|nr:DUF3298 and DUF4163 domain-containing protein [Romboutsia hominis]
MNKKRNIRVFMSLICIALLSLILLYNTELVDISSKVKANIVDSIKTVKVTEERSKIECKNLSIIVRMPKLYCDNKNAERYINSFIRNNINSYINHKRQDIELQNNKQKTNILLEYNLAFQSKDVINIVIVKETKSGKNKFSTNKESYVFDLKTGQRIYIDNLLGEDENYKELIKSYINKTIDENKIDIDKNLVIIDKETNFIIVDGGLSIILDQNKDGKMREYEFKVPYDVFNNKVKSINTKNIIANVDTQTITQNNKYINSILNIPIIISSNKDIDKELNYKIRKDIMDFYNKVYESAKNYFDNVDVSKDKFVANVDYEVKKNSDDILSIKVTYHQYSGGAHEDYEDISYNIDMRSGKILKLSDLFKPNSDYIKVINNEIRRQIEELVKNNKEYEGIYQFESIEKDNKFYIEDNNIVIYFDLYKIAPFAAGIPEFKINNSIISHMLKEEYLEILK